MKSGREQPRRKVEGGRRKTGNSPLSTTHYPLSTTHYPLSARRGVLLLLILALLAMFGLIAVAFVVLTGQAQRSARSIERIDLTTDPPPKVLQQAAMQVFRGSSSPASVMGAHSLLEDIYGNGWQQGTISNVTPVCGGQLLQFQFTYGSGPTTPAIRTGCVVTVIDPTSPAYLQSSRIVGFNPTTGDLQTLAFAGSTQPANNTPVVINGAAFGGPGFGYNATTGQLDLLYDSTTSLPTSPLKTTGEPSTTLWPVALLPNLPLSTYTLLPVQTLYGTNSDYTAPDYQHMLLAMMDWDTTHNTTIVPIPSLHRPELVRYWVKQLVGAGVDFTTPTSQTKLNYDSWFLALPADLRHKIVMRPIGGFPAADHPDFTGSNPNFNPLWDGTFVDNNSDGICDFSWDVDNDGDGVSDSVWVDLGMPVRSTTDGRMYKPLFAILCLDLDGRLNLNAQGCLAQTAIPKVANALAALPGTHAIAGVKTPTALPRGLGYGPAEINLGAISGNYSNLLAVRYPASGWIGGNAGHYLSLNKWFLYGGGDYWNSITPATVNNSGAFGTPPDLWGIGAMALDWGGRPLYLTMGQVYNSGGTSATLPYELDLSEKRLRGGQNTPFSATELERLLRPYDRDATSLPNRLAPLLAATLTPYQRRTFFTTDSWDVPAPSTAISADLVPGLTLPTAHIVDLLTALLRNRTPTLTDAEINAMLPSLFASELLAGGKMDLNRAFGNGRDDNAAADPGYGVVDEPNPAEGTASTPEKVPLYDSATPTIATPNVNYDPRGTATGAATTSLEARQLYARYLYVLAMLLAERDALKPLVAAQMGIPVASVTPNDIPPFLAQWAVNVVDFYDRDSIMTPFQYDLNPFTSAGWTAPTGVPTSTTNLVWGCERPELLITETLAFHDRRTEDLADFGYSYPPTVSDKKETDIGDNIDDFDQQYKPQGSLFVELYNPWSDLEPRPYELCNPSNGGVDLTKATPTTSVVTTSSPVWRLAIVNQGDAPHDPDDATTPPTLQRTVYFTAGAAVTLPTDGAEVQFTPNAEMSSKIRADPARPLCVDRPWRINRHDFEHDLSGT